MNEGAGDDPPGPRGSGEASAGAPAIPNPGGPGPGPAPVSDSPLAPGKGSANDRLTCYALAALAALAIALSFFMSPDPRGHGSHEQLGLPPCVTLTALRAPCPFCGMTTSFCNMSHGRFVEAFRSHPTGPLLYAILWLSLPFHLYWARTRRSLLAVATDWPLERPVTWGFVAVLIGWALKLTFWWEPGA